MPSLLCFRGSSSHSEKHEITEPPRPRPANHRVKTNSWILHRHGSAESRSSTTSNESISKLPPCKRLSDPKVEAMMMPVPPEPRPSRCLRLSQPKTYSDIVDSMKAHKGCRDWRNFAVFHPDEVDNSLSAEDVARRRAADYERKLRQFASFSSGNDSDKSVEVDMIG